MARPKTRDAGLRQHILETSLSLLADHGPSALTARNVANEAGSSTAALYELFGDKSGLIRSVFYEGFHALAELLHALPETTDAGSDLVESLETSRRFGVEGPMLFELMNARPFPEFDPGKADVESAKVIYRHFTARVARWLEADRRSKATLDAAQVLMALNNGLIQAELAGLLGSSKASIERRRQVGVTAMLTGLKAEQAAG